ncbi:MAG: fructose-6-phosphate aldolase [Ruminococcaceae bacterium]|nr:fructose-6-phosphate aldolase [Oscillospiraceae bacterium]
MKIFADTANLSDIKEALAGGAVSGVTTNPTLIAREEGSFEEMIGEIAGMTDGPVFAEVTTYKASEMVEEGRKLSKIRENVVIKIPMCEEGIKAVSVLEKEGIKTNVTLVFSAAQALLAANAGATYVSSFIGRLDDISYDGSETVAQISSIFASYGIKTQIIAASIRGPLDVIRAAEAGADIATVPYKVIKQMYYHPLTEKGIEKFIKDWEARQ